MHTNLHFGCWSRLADHSAQNCFEYIDRRDLKSDINQLLVVEAKYFSDYLQNIDGSNMCV